MTVARKLGTAKVDLVADVEKAWQVPEAGIAYIEINPDVDEEIRIAFKAGETGDTGSYFPVDPGTQWWTPEIELKLVDNEILYFRCAVNNTLRILFAVK